MKKTNSTSFILLFLILTQSGCASFLDSDIQKRVDNNELVLIETLENNSNFLAMLLNSTLDREPETHKVKILRIDGIDVESTLFTSSQEVAVKPGRYKIKCRCSYEPAEKDKNENEDWSDRTEEFDLEIKLGYKYQLSSEPDDSNTCRTEIKEVHL
jgi:hypothetical protein